jgi:HAD superfamily hydrolase (TIGR01509 family)
MRYSCGMFTMKAVIFDFDGVLANTEPLHYRMFRDVLAEEGLTLTFEDYTTMYVGLTDAACFHAVLEACGQRPRYGRINSLVEKKTRRMQAALLREPVLLPGIAEFVRAAGAQYRLAVASGALREEIELTLERAGFRDAFEHITAAQDVPNGKPAPDPYEHAVRHLNRRIPLLPGECLAIEDTPHGVSAARRAGLRCLAVATSVSQDELWEADAVTLSLDGYDLAALASKLWAPSTVR